MLGPLAIATFAVSAPTANDLDRIALETARAARAKFTKPALQEDQIGISIRILDPAAKTYVVGGYRAEDAMYPASVVKMFYMAYAADQLERRRLEMTPELERALKDMIVDSSNDATALVLDTLTGTTGGPELPPDALKDWMDRRQIVNRWFRARGYEKVNACQKTWNEAPYGRERQGYGPNFELRNSLTPDECGRLMAEIALNKIATSERCDWMRSLMSRKPLAESADADVQSRDFTGRVVPAGYKLWSKAGFTSTVRHDVAHLRALDGREVVLAIFTQGHSANEELLPFLAKSLLEGLGLMVKTK